MRTYKFNLLICMGLCASLLFSKTYSTNPNINKLWGYYLQITDASYIPAITSEDIAGYITLESGIAEYDAIYAKYWIKDFYQYAPTAETESLRQIYALVCDSGQTNLGTELTNNYSDIIPMIEIFNLTPNFTAAPQLSSSTKTTQRGTNLFLGDNDKSRKINFFNIGGYLVYSTETSEDIINPLVSLPHKGIFPYEIIEDKDRTTGLYINF